MRPWRRTSSPPRGANEKRALSRRRPTVGFMRPFTTSGLPSGEVRHNGPYPEHDSRAVRARATVAEAAGPAPRRVVGREGFEPSTLGSRVVKDHAITFGPVC